MLVALLVNIDFHCGIELLGSHGHGRDNGGLVKRVDHANKGEELSSGEAWHDQDGTSGQIEEKGLSIEQIFDTKKVPPSWEQITFRGIFVSMLLGIMFCIIVMKLNLTTGIIPSLNVFAGLLGFFFIKTWTKFLEKFGLLKTPFTRQENTVIQTYVVACYGIAFSGTVIQTYVVACYGIAFSEGLWVIYFGYEQKDLSTGRHIYSWEYCREYQRSKS